VAQDHRGGRHQDRVITRPAINHRIATTDDNPRLGTAIEGTQMLGGFISDLEKGDVFKPVEYVITPFMCSEYAHGTEETSEFFHSPQNPLGRQIRLPTMIHVDKMRILEENCAMEKRIAGMKGPDARVHYEYHAKHHSVAYVGEKLVVTGHIVDKYVKRGRPYLWYYLEVRTSDGRLVTTYNDLTLLRYKVEGAQ
jgi:hypothetical protein